jgi:hypothetical protein
VSRIVKLPFNWATGIVLSYVVFATATLGFVVFALRRPVDLVAPDYYAQSLRQDRQMEAVRNARDLHATVVQSVERGLLVTLPAAQAGDARGSVTLYRPSDASADRVVALKTDAAGRQQIPLQGLEPGVWSVRVRWTAQGREFYVEERLVTR